MNEHIHIFALGGLDEEGKNLYIIQIDDDIFVIEAGIKYPDKNTPGIDYLISDYSYLKEHKENIKAYIITHGHDDVLGALAFIYKDCPAPVYCSEVTKIFIDSFIEHVGTKIKINYNIVNSSDVFEISNRKISLFSTCHSMPNSFGVSIDTQYGNIVYASDFIIENNSYPNFNYDTSAVSNIIKKKTLLLMVESEFASRPGYTTPKHRLSSIISPIFDVEFNGKIFIASTADNAFAIAEIIKIAKLYKRKICFYDDETKEVFDKLKIIKECSIDESSIINFYDINRHRSGDILVIILGFNERLYKKIDKFSKHNTFIEYDQNDVFISAIPPKSRYEVMSARSLDNLYRSGLKVYGISKKELISMHPSEEDIKSLISVFNPTYYLPVKGRYINLIDNAMDAYNMSSKLSHNNIFVLENGVVLDINNGIAKTLPDKFNIKVGTILIDGINQSSSLNSVCSDRIKLGNDGVVVVTATISLKESRIVSNIDVSLNGVSFSKEYKNIGNTIINEFKDCIDNLLLGNFNLYSAETLVSERIGKVIKRDTNKEPIIMPIINII